MALEKAWAAVAERAEKKEYTIRFLNDTYQLDLARKQVSSLSCNVPAKTFYSIILLHYLERTLQGLAPLENEWISFQELPGGQAYYPAFKKRVIDTIARKYQHAPETLLELPKRFPARKDKVADLSVVLEVCEKVPVLITFWRGDEEFHPEANMLFDKNINAIFCTEDIVVVAEIIAHSI
ncbi:MAG: DUF3786 domain-containing protein [Candidatus Omnitrophota bacterium]